MAGTADVKASKDNVTPAPEPTAITVLGAGAWGLTLADLLARKGHAVTLWDRKTDALRDLAETRTSPRLTGLALHEGVACQPDFAAATGAADVVVIATASQAIPSLCEQTRAAGGQLGRGLVINTSKGVDPETLLRPSQTFAECFGDDAMQARFAVLSGPSHAEEVVRQVPTTVSCAAFRDDVASRARDLFNTRNFRVYTQPDVPGVELGGAFKNVLAIAAGACDGAGFGDNTKAALITRGLAEITRAAVVMGARQHTLAGLAGMGDLIVTAMSGHSRNRLFGQLLAQGLTPQQALEKVGAVVEGYRTAKSAHLLSLKIGVEMPICTAVYRVTHEDLPLRDALNQLLSRDPKPEVY